LCFILFGKQNYFNTDMPTFVLSDGNTVNSYGFRVRTEGISLARFRNNPVMLDEHWNSTRSVLGRWENVRVEGTELKADTLFDDADADTAKVKGKVDRGFIKGASVGLTFSREDMKLQPDGSYLLMKCELLEASIVAVPSNANAIRLYAKDTMQAMSQEEVKLCLPPQQQQKPQIKMSKLVLSAVALTALAIASTDDEAQLAASIENLVADRDALKLKVKALTDKALEQVQAQAKALVANAIADGKLTADVQAEFETLAINNYDLAAKVIGAMPGKKSLNGLLTSTTGGVGEVKSVDDFEKLSHEKQLAFKNENPEAYKALFV
jgi:HK97 family phage prohead protease